MAVILGSGVSGNPLRCIGGESEKYLQSTTIIGSGVVATIGSGDSLEDLTQASLLAYDYGKKTVTKANGDRHLVNKGTEGGTALMKTGQGVRFDGTNSVSNVGTLDLTKDFTLLWVQEKTVELGQHGSHNVDAGSYFGFDSNGLSVGIGDGWVGTPIAGQLGRLFNFFVRYAASTKIVEFGTLDLTVSGSFSAGNYGTLLPMDLGRIANNAITATGTLKDFYHFEGVFFSNQQLEMHRQQPERTIYKKNGVLKSAFLPQSVLADVENGVGCWYPMSEGQGSLISNHALKDTSDNLLVNGDFSDGANGWNTANWWVAQNGTIHMPETSEYKLLSQDVTILAGSIVEFEVLSITGLAKVAFDGGQITTFGTIGIKRIVVPIAQTRIDFSRQVGSTCEMTLGRVKVYTPKNLLTNGDFSNGSTGWATNNWWVIQNGVAHMPLISGFVTLAQIIDIPVGARIEFDVVSIVGVGKVIINNVATSFNSTGRVSVVAPTGGSVLYFSRNSGSVPTEMTLDNIKMYLPNSLPFKEVVNAGNSDIWGNGEEQTKGSQMALVTRDSSGVITGLADKLQFDGSSVIEFDTPIVLTGDWCLDMFCDVQDNTATQNISMLEGSSAGNTDLLLYKSINDTKLRLRVHNVYTAMTGTTPTRGVWSVECVAGVLTAYANGVLVGTGAGVETQTTIVKLGQRYSITSQGFQGESGDLKITRTSRTASERVTAVNPIMTKHKVII